MAIIIQPSYNQQQSSPLSPCHTTRWATKCHHPLRVWLASVQDRPTNGHPSLSYRFNTYSNSTKKGNILTDAFGNLHLLSISREMKWISTPGFCQNCYYFFTSLSQLFQQSIRSNPFPFGCLLYVLVHGEKFSFQLLACSDLTNQLLLQNFPSPSVSSMKGKVPCQKSTLCVYLTEKT